MMPERGTDTPMKPRGQAPLERAAIHRSPLLAVALLLVLSACLTAPARADVIGRGQSSTPVDLYSNIPDLRVGDLVTIKVSEGATTATDSTMTKGSKTSSSQTFNGLLGLLLPNLNRDISSTNSNKQSQSLTTVLTARVVKVEGSQVQLAATRMVTMDGNKVNVVLQGRARMKDVSADNVLESYRLGDLQLQIAGLKGKTNTDILQSVYRFLF